MDVAISDFFLHLVFQSPITQVEKYTLNKRRRKICSCRALQLRI
jgi:hypothetical protein